jgi:hypothetical protein
MSYSLRISSTGISYEKFGRKVNQYKRQAFIKSNLRKLAIFPLLLLSLFAAAMLLISHSTKVLAYTETETNVSKLTRERISNSINRSTYDQTLRSAVLSLDPTNTLKVVKLQVDGETNTIHTYADTVEGLLESQELHDVKLTAPKRSTIVFSGMLIQTQNISTEILEEKVSIPHAVSEVTTYELYKGEKRVVQEGADGIKIVKTKAVKNYKGVLNAEVISEKVIKEPTTKIIEFGLKEKAVKDVVGLNNGCNQWDAYIEKVSEKKKQEEWLKYAIRCESGCNAEANNSNMYLGLLQFSEYTFEAYGGENIWNGYEQIDIALQLYKSGEADHHWPNCSI